MRKTLLMSAPTIENWRPVDASWLRRLVIRHPTAAFLLMAFGIGWSGLFPLLLSENGPFGVLPIELPWKPFASLLSVFALALPAFLLTAATGGRAGVRDLLRRTFRWRVGVRWYLIALFGLLAVTVLGATPFVGVVPLEALAQKWDLLFTLFLWGVLVPFVFVNLWEEAGWTGFMQHTLQERHGPLLASVMVAPFFALIHMPAYFVSGWLGGNDVSLGRFPSVLLQVGILAVFAIFIRVLIMWLYNSTGRSVLLVGLFHSAFNMTSSSQNITPELVPGPAAALIPAAAVAVLAVLVVVFTRGRLAYEPEHAARRPDEAGRVAARQSAK